MIYPIVIVICCIILFFVFLTIFTLLFAKNFLVCRAVRKNFKNRQNRDNFENDIDNFYKGAPQEGYYIQHLWKVYHQLSRFIKRKEFKCLVSKTIVFDIDDTLLWAQDFSHKYIPPIAPMVKLFKEAAQLGYIIIIITARAPESLQLCYENLNVYGMYPDKIFTSLFYGQDQTFKEKMRKNLEFVDKAELEDLDSHKLFSLNRKTKKITNLKIILTIGDRWNDVKGVDNMLGVKLPEPKDMNSYYYFNNNITIFQ